jgi:hypothetical protein
MTDAVVLSAGRRYDVVFDRTNRRIVFARGAVTDDADGRPVPPPYAVGVDEPLLDAGDHDGGFALAGDPDVALTDTSIPHALALTIVAHGYRPADAVVTIPVAPIFPIDVPVALRRRPVRLAGRVMAAATGAPVPAARLALTGPALPLPARALLLSPPLAADLGPAAILQGHAIAAVASPVPVKTARAAAAGTIEIFLDDLQGLAPGQLLHIGPPERAHWVEIASLAAPFVVRLTAPLDLSVREGDPAAPFSLGAAMGPAAAPIGEAFAGEAVIIADAAAAGDVLVITDAPAPARHHMVGAIAGPSGDYAIPGLARLASVRLSVTAAGFTGQNRTIPLPRSSPAATLDWRLIP